MRRHILGFFSVLIICTSALATDRPFRILSIDGGGVRGIVPAVMLEQIEEQLQRPIHEVFDMVAGSSTGGIIALSLATGSLTAADEPNYTAEEVVDLYINNSVDIFSASWTHKLSTMGGLLGPKYETTGLRNMLEQKLGNTMLSQTLIPTLITGYHIEGESGVEFFSEDAKKYPKDKDCLLTEVGLATAAAPIYFESVDVNYAWGTLKSVADGGIYKQNPALLAYLNAKKINQGRKIEVYSLGTGSYSSEELDAQFKGRGLLQWLTRIMGHLTIGGTEADDTVLHRLLNEDGEENYFRLNVHLSADHSKMDDSSEENLKYLYDQAMLSTQTPMFIEMVKRLKM